jgi:hypothetical protein
VRQASSDCCRSKHMDITTRKALQLSSSTTPKEGTTFPPLRSSSQHSWPFTAANGIYHLKYHQRTQPDHPEETPQSRLDIRGPRRNSPGWALLRIMHLVLSLHQRKTTTPIYTHKFNWSKAYYRQHYSVSAVLECATQCGGLMRVHLRLTFGGS